MTANPRNALVAGAGIGGLAAAIALADRGFDVLVCERRSEFPEEGAGIQIGPNGSRILRDLGVEKFLETKVAHPDALSVRDGATGRELTQLPLGHWIAERHGAPYWTAHRRDLHVALRTRVEAEPRITLTRGTGIVSFENRGDGIRASAANGETFDAAVLIAADGLWSTLREQIGGSRKSDLIPAGKTAFRSVLPAGHLPPELVSNAVHIWLSPGAHVVHYPVNGGNDIALVVIADDVARVEGWDSPIVADVVKAKVGSSARSSTPRTLGEAGRSIACRNSRIGHPAARHFLATPPIPFCRFSPRVPSWPLKMRSRWQTLLRPATATSNRHSANTSGHATRASQR